MYDPRETKRYSESLGLEFSAADFTAFAERAEEQELTQEQLDFVLREHAWRLACLFNPKSYKPLARIAIALHFLNPFAKGVR